MFDLQFQEIETFNFEENILHVLHLSEDKILILCLEKVYILENSEIYNDWKKKIELEDPPASIISGCCLRNNKFFLHITKNNNHEGRIYNLKGKLLSNTILTESLG